MTDHSNRSADSARMAQLAEEIEDSYSGNFVEDILLHESDRRLIVTALNGFAGVAQPTPELLFCHWLKGYFGAVKGRDELTPHEANTIRGNLNELLSSDGEPSNGKQPLMASRPAPPVPSDPQCSAGTEALSRQNIAKAIAYDLEEGPAHGARVATSPYLDNYHVNGHVNLLALADAVIAQLRDVPQAVGITDEMIERGAKAYSPFAFMRDGDGNYRGGPGSRVDAKDAARRVLEAAFPLPDPSHQICTCTRTMREAAHEPGCPLSRPLPQRDEASPGMSSHQGNCK